MNTSNSMNLSEKMARAELYLKALLGVDVFPKYIIEHKNDVSLEVSETKGFEVPAAAKYDIGTGVHTILISDNLPLYEYLMVHELTHVWDDDNYTQGDKIRYCGLRGYTEYHASQNELMYLLGLCKTADEKFSMKTKIEVLAGEITVEEYVELKRQHASELFASSLFTQDVEVMISSLGALFNYFGLRSICKMYSFDYEEIVDNSAFLQRLSTMEFVTFNQMMQGWLDETSINTIINGFACVENRLLSYIR